MSSDQPVALSVERLRDAALDWLLVAERRTEAASRIENDAESASRIALTLRLVATGLERGRELTDLLDELRAVELCDPTGRPWTPERLHEIARASPLTKRLDTHCSLISRR